MSKNHFPYIPHTVEDVRRMCEAIGVSSLSELLSVFPEELLLKGDLNLPSGLSEQKLKRLMVSKGERNKSATEISSFLGAGSYNHYIPSIVDHTILRSEFFTAYTPYQPEISQGTLQAIFEYQTLICQLTGMDASNASLYDGASAMAEAALMARRKTKGKNVLISSALHPEYRATVRSYLNSSRDCIHELDYDKETGATDIKSIEDAIDNDTACVVIGYPNFFGAIEDIEAIGEIAHKNGAYLVVVVTEALSMALLKPPGELGADIVVGEAGSFGASMSFGGPSLGFMATTNDGLRQMPGRVVGETKDKNGKRAFCLTLATREQHIRREKATSNICTNEGLLALAAAVYMASLGKGGLMELALLNLSKAVYLREKLIKTDKVSTVFSSPTFNEFVIKVKGSADLFLEKLLKKNIVGGLSLERFYPELTGHILVTATEMNSREGMDLFIKAVSDEG